MRGHSPPCSGVSDASIGPSSFTRTCHAVSVVSSEKNGCSPAVHSPQPIRPSDRTSARRILRSVVTPKLVSNGRTRGRCSSRRIIPSILIRIGILGISAMNWKLFQSSSWPERDDSSSIHLRLSRGTQFEDSITLRVAHESKHGEPVAKRFFKPAAILQLYRHGALPVFLGCLPLVDGCWNQDTFLNCECGLGFSFKSCRYSRRGEMPFCHQTVCGQASLQPT